MFIAVMEALKAHDCITGYTATELGLIPEWRAEGVQRAYEELTSNVKPFGLRKSHRGILMQVLPKNERDKIYSAFLEKYRSASSPVK